MATRTVAAPARVAAVLVTASTWTAGRRKADNKPFFFIPGSKDGAVYMTAVDGCTCPAAQNSRTGSCKHHAARVLTRDSAILTGRWETAGPFPRRVTWLTSAY